MPPVEQPAQYLRRGRVLIHGLGAVHDTRKGGRRLCQTGTGLCAWTADFDSNARLDRAGAGTLL